MTLTGVVNIDFFLLVWLTFLSLWNVDRSFEWNGGPPTCYQLLHYMVQTTITIKIQSQIEESLQLDSEDQNLLKKKL